MSDDLSDFNEVELDLIKTKRERVSLERVHPELARETLTYLELIATGRGKITAGLAVGWTPAKTKELWRDSEFSQLVAVARELKTETIEQRVFELADRGNIRAIELQLFCQASDRGWRPPAQRVQTQSHHLVQVEVVESARAAALAIMERHGVAALQPGGALDRAIGSTASDA